MTAEKESCSINFPARLDYQLSVKVPFTGFKLKKKNQAKKAITQVHSVK